MITRPLTRWLAWLELGVTGALAPWFIVPSLGFRPWMMAVPLVFWGMRWLARGVLTSVTPLDVPILGMSMMLGVSVLVTFDMQLSLPKAAGIYYGIIVYFALVNNASWQLVKRGLIPALLLAGYGLAGLSLFGLRWTGPKLPLIGGTLSAIGAGIPRLLAGIPRAEKGLSSNQVAGTLILFIPLQATCLVHTLAQRRDSAKAWVSLVGSAAGLVLTLGTLLLTQSRGALGAAFLTLSALSAYYLRRKLWLVLTLVGLAVLMASGIILLPETIEHYAEMDIETLTGDISLSARPEIWARAIRMLKDHPFTGIGLDAFPKVLSTRYPPFEMRKEAAQVIPHAHNLYLQVAMDLGMPGLVAFLALVMTATWMLVRALQCSRTSTMQAVALGVLAGMWAQFLYGWVDCIALGQKPGIFFWVYLAISTLLYQHAYTSSE